MGKNIQVNSFGFINRAMDVFCSGVVFLTVLIFSFHEKAQSQTLSISVESAGFRLKMDQGGRRAYHMQSSLDLNEWVDIGAPFSFATITDSYKDYILINGDSNFYRVVDNGAVFDNVNSPEWLRIDPVPIPPGEGLPDQIASLHNWLEAQFKKFKFNGGVLIVHETKVLLAKAYGFTDHTAEKRLDSRSAFPLASVSKQFTAAGVLRLADQGKLKLDDTVSTHLSGFIFNDVTVRHLLNQTSGLPDEYMDLAEEHSSELGDILTISDVVDLVNRHSVAEYDPGEVMEYSNTNYVLLAAIVEAVSGAAFEDFMREELFRPLGMKDARVWNLLSEDFSPNQVFDFEQVNDERKPMEITWLDGVAGDGAVLCSLNDFIIWDRFWYGNPIVSDNLLQEALKSPELNDGSKSDYGFGWIIEDDRQWHDGSWLGSNTYIARYPGSRSCIVVLDNSSNPRVDDIVRQIEVALDIILPNSF